METFAGSAGHQLQQNLSASTLNLTGANYISPFGESSYNTDPLVSCNHRYPFGQQFQSGVPGAPPPDPVGCSSLFSVPIPGPSRHSSDSFSVMTSRTKSKGKDRPSNKRGTSVM
jgi:hypothetical protein